MKTEQQQVTRKEHATGGYVYTLTNQGNVYMPSSKLEAIKKAIIDSYVDTVFSTPEGKIQCLMLNGITKSLKCNDDNVFYFE